MLLAAGEPFAVGGGRTLSTAEWTVTLQQQLEAAQDELAAASLSREAAAFTTLLQGRRGTAGPYAVWQRLRARLSGQAYHADHPDQTPPSHRQAPAVTPAESLR